ncbi:hypothetical protein BpHYR1_045808 [Brachionus plicatilis]|uniref:Uncharacterized protein n=1 Tax=Brachionus plicatilis TaxID=10195 RepID=A0A3M7SYM4_BRAPC|nr:hypothetical protein BpHYR1_045808 [Brachionus plicatilis]
MEKGKKISLYCRRAKKRYFYALFKNIISIEVYLESDEKIFLDENWCPIQYKHKKVQSWVHQNSKNKNKLVHAFVTIDPILKIIYWRGLNKFD